MAAQADTSGFTYRAFISYSHRDQAWARWLIRKLEGYRIPRDLAGNDGDRRLGTFFRDRDEAAAADDLATVIRQALETSEHLIVVASPAAARSAYVEQEIREFAALNRQRAHRGRILTLIADGEPNADDPAQECLPPALRGGLSGEDGAPIEPLAADARPTGDGKPRALAKLVAGLIDVRYDALVRRDLQRRRRIRASIAAAIGAIVVISGGVAWKFVADSRERQALAAARERADSQRRTVTAVSNAERAKALLAAGNKDGAVQLAQQSLPDDGSLPFIPQAFATLYGAYMGGGAPVNFEIAGSSGQDAVTLPLADGQFLTWTDNGQVRVWSPGGGISYATQFLTAGSSRKPIVSPKGDAVFIPAIANDIRYRVAAHAWDEVDVAPVEVGGVGGEPEVLQAIDAATLLGCERHTLFELTLPPKGSGPSAVAWQTDLDLTGFSCDGLATGADGTIYVASGGTIVAVDPETRKETRRYEGAGTFLVGIDVHGDRLEARGISESAIFHLGSDEPPLKLTQSKSAWLLGPHGRYATTTDIMAEQLTVHDLASGTKTTVACSLCSLVGYSDNSLLVLEDNRVVQRRLPSAEPVATVHEFRTRVDDTQFIADRGILIGIRSLQPETIVKLGDRPKGILVDRVNTGDQLLSSAAFLNDDAAVLVETERTGPAGSITGRTMARIVPAVDGGGEPLWERDISGTGPTGYGSVDTLGHNLIAVTKPQSMMSWPASVEVMAPLDNATVLKQDVLSDPASDASGNRFVMDGKDGIAVVDLVKRESRTIAANAIDWQVAGERLLIATGDGTIAIYDLTADDPTAAVKKLVMLGGFGAFCAAADDDTLFALTASKTEVFLERWSLADAARTAQTTIDQKESADIVEELAFFATFDRAMRLGQIRCTPDSVTIDGADKRVSWDASGPARLVPKVDVAEQTPAEDADVPAPSPQALQDARLVTIDNVAALRGRDGTWLFRTPKQEAKVSAAVLLRKHGWVAIGLENGHLRVWSVTTPAAPLIDIAAHQARIDSLAVNPAETEMLTADGGGRVRLWPVFSVAALIAHAAEVVPHQ